MPVKLLKSKRYPNLYKNEDSGIWQFRKYSNEKGRSFFRSTGEKTNEARAYRLGLELFNKWLGRLTEEDGSVLFRRYATQYLDQKLNNPKLSERTKLRFRGDLEASLTSSGRKETPRPRLIEALGHLPLERIDNDAWMRYVAEVAREHPNFKFFNARKALLEILRDAYDKRFIDRVPKLELSDAEAAPPRELTREEIRRLFRAAYYVPKVRGPGKTLVLHRDARGLPLRHRGWIKLLMFIIWKQGARPGEILQYEWEMIHFTEGKHGKLYIPGRITKTRRARQIALNPQVSRLLRRLRRGNPTGTFLFPSDNPVRPIRVYQKRWEGVCRRAGMHAQIYWFRDTFVSRKLMQGANTILIAKYLDTSAEMLERKYAVAGDEAQESVAK